jgi:hypothetical protein
MLAGVVLPGDVSDAANLARFVLGGFILDDFRHMKPETRNVLHERLAQDVQNRTKQIIEAYQDDPFQLPEEIKLLAFMFRYGFSSIPEDASMDMVISLLRDTGSSIAQGVRSVVTGIKEIRATAK